MHQKTRAGVVALTAGLVGLVSSVAIAQDVAWPGFRGPTGDGLVSGPSHPLEWGYGEDGETNIAWAIDVPGASWSSPLVVDDAVYVVTAAGEGIGRPAPFRGQGGGGADKPDAPAEFQVRCYALRDGSERWATTVAREAPAEPTHPSNTFATESPTTDGERIYVHFGAIGIVAAVDLDGKELWQKDIGAYPHTAGFGTGSSIVVHDGTLVVHSDNTAESFVLGLDAETGEEKWKRERDAGSAWASPLLAPRGDGTQVIIAGSGAVSSYDVATGELLWKATGIEGSFSTSPVADEEHVYFGNSGPGRRGPLIAVRLDAEGEFAADPADERVGWVSGAQGFAFSSPVIVDGVLYAARGRFFAAHDCETGERVYRERLPDQGEVVASAWAVDGVVYVMNETGMTFAIPAGGEFEVKQTNTIEGDIFSSTPSVAKGNLLIRGADKLYCIRAEGS